MTSNRSHTETAYHNPVKNEREKVQKMDQSMKTVSLITNEIIPRLTDIKRNGAQLYNYKQIIERYEKYKDEFLSGTV